MSAVRTTALAGVAAAAIALVSFATVPTIAQPTSDKTVMVGGAAMYPNKNIIQNAVNSKDHTTLVAAVKAAGLVDTLEGAGPFTVFAPTNEAFAELPKGTVENLLKPENKVKADAMADTIKKMIKDDGGKHTVKTVSGGTLVAMMKGDKIELQDENGGIATVTIANVKQSNGVIHVIDHVLLPK